MSKAKRKRLHWMIDHCMTIERLWDESMEECRELRATIEEQTERIKRLTDEVEGYRQGAETAKAFRDQLVERNKDLVQQIRELGDQIEELENTRNTPDIRPFGPEIPARTTTKKETV